MSEKLTKQGLPSSFDGGSDMLYLWRGMTKRFPREVVRNKDPMSNVYIARRVGTFNTSKMIAFCCDF